MVNNPPAPIQQPANIQHPQNNGGQHVPLNQIDQILAAGHHPIMVFQHLMPNANMPPANPAAPRIVRRRLNLEE